MPCPQTLASVIGAIDSEQAQACSAGAGIHARDLSASILSLQKSILRNSVSSLAVEEHKSVATNVQPQGKEPLQPALHRYGNILGLCTECIAAGQRAVAARTT